MSNTYSTSDGERLTTKQINIRMQCAKRIKLDKQKDEYGYNFCSRCKRNDCKPIDVSHNISVKEAKETGRAELCYALSNLEILGRGCHAKKDKLNIQWNDTVNNNRR